MTADPETIWLEPSPHSADGDRCWSRNDDWSGLDDRAPTRYVRADLHEALRAENERLRAALVSDVEEHGATGEHAPPVAYGEAQWLPIETAPRDGTMLELMQVARGAWGLCENDGLPFLGFAFAPIAFEPTHYRLPSPPKPEAV